MPSISAALVLDHESAAFSAPICSADHGSHQAAVQESAPSSHDAHFDHCPLCIKHGGTFSMLQPADFTVPQAASELHARAFAQTDFFSAVAWILLPSRAPPAHS